MAAAAPEPKWLRKSRAKKKVEDSSSEVTVLPEVTVRTKHPQGNWLKNTDWTDHLVKYLTDNSEFRRKLFSDSTAEAKKRRPHQIHRERRLKHPEPARYTNYPRKTGLTVFNRLKWDYQKRVQRIGATGAGLNPTSVKEGTALASLIDEVRNGFPWWDELHGFWRELANYNPVGVQSSEPGTDHASTAADLYELEQQNTTSCANRDATPPADEDNNQSLSLKAHAGTETHTTSDYEGSEGLPEKPPKSAAKRPSQVRVKAKPTASGGDLGLTKANSSKSIAPAKRKPPTVLERLSDFRESESTRMGEKRKLQHTEEMERMKIKRMKYEVKLLTAQNEQAHLNPHVAVPESGP
ncbi:hypothetical protein C8F04DRAFT_1263430 [Mycena alexandri]|uniref:Uncharacterized protein n=1 Tax=Mycena alexandri TaxID=1745969 RepID=A0AAD6SPC5_9AGAR|nr:hypothetical protein C8F04DRAFT_1263430 [Mycena alexandri]